MAQQLAYPKDRIKFLLLENVSAKAAERLNEAGYTQVERLEKALPKEELKARISDVHVVGLRSKTKLTEEVLQEANKLHAIGAFCIGTDQVDLNFAQGQGIPVFNSPHSSTRSVAELTIGALVALFRQTFPRSTAAHRGEWIKSAKGAHELRAKTLGIVGYGRIGSQVGILAEAMGMEVRYYDIVPKMAMGRAQPVESLEALLEASDVVTLHVPDDETTRGMIGPEELKRFRTGAYLINYARGKILEAQAVADALHSGQLGGAAVDVFAQEPAKNSEPFSNPLQGCPNTLLTPHIGGSTEEAQAAIGMDVADKLVRFLDEGQTLGNVTLPELTLPRQEGAHRLLHIHENRPGTLTAINRHFSDLGVNLQRQYLQTKDQLGYVVLDIEQQGVTDEAEARLRDIPGTLRVRKLY